MSKRRMQRTYTTEDQDRGFQALVLCSGNSRHASKLTAEAGDRISAPTLRRWASDPKLADRYEAVKTRLAPELDKRFAEAFEELAQRYIAIQREAVERMGGKMDEASLSQLATTAQKAAIGAGISADKASMFRGRPSTIIGHTTVNVPEMMDTIRRKWPQLFVEQVPAIDSTATEVGEEQTDE